MENATKQLALTAIAQNYARELVTLDDTLDEAKLRDLIVANGNDLIPGANFIGFPGSFFVHHSYANEQKRDQFLAVVGGYLAGLNQEAPVSKVLKRLTVDFTEADQNEVGLLINAVTDTPAHVKTGKLLLPADLYAGLADQASPFFELTRVAFRWTLNTILGDAARVQAIIAKIETASQNSTLEASKLFQIHFAAVVYWFVAVILPPYAVGLLRKREAGKDTLIDLSKQVVDNGNPFLNHMQTIWIWRLPNTKSAPTDESVTENLGKAGAATIQVPQLIQETLAAIKDGTEMPSIVAILKHVIGGRVEVELKIMTAIYAATIIAKPSGTGTGTGTIDSVLESLPKNLGMTKEEVIKSLTQDAPDPKQAPGGKASEEELKKARQEGEKKTLSSLKKSSAEVKKLEDEIARLEKEVARLAPAVEEDY